MSSLSYSLIVWMLTLVLMGPGICHAQEPGLPAQPTAPALDDERMDVFDLVRALRHKAPEPVTASDERKVMATFAPVVGAKPSAGALAGMAGNVAFYRGDPSTTHISSDVVSITFSTRGQTAVTNHFTMFTRDDRWRLEGDERLHWTSLETHALGTGADTSVGTLTQFDFFRLHQSGYYRVGSGLFAGAGLYFDNHVEVAPQDGNEAAWPASPYVQYSEASGLPLDAQASAGISLDLLWDSRDSVINPEGGAFGKASYRTLFDGFLGGDSNWQRLNIDVRGYRKISSDSRHKLAVWGFVDLVLEGTAPYFDLPATGTDTYGRSARGYAEGQFRGERLAYGELEYRGALTRNGLLGMVVFLNSTTATNLSEGERLFDSFATGGGAGLRLLINKRSKTNLCFDVAFGEQGSRGVYLAIQEAF